ncbi:hypothetical protein ACEPAI_3126 [Sanghuangporus weigelae]
MSATPQRLQMCGAVASNSMRFGFKCLKHSKMHKRRAGGGHLFVHLIPPIIFLHSGAVFSCLHSYLFDMVAIAFTTLSSRDSGSSTTSTTPGMDTGSESSHSLIYLVLLIFLVLLALFTVSAYIIHRFLHRHQSNSKTEGPRFAIRPFKLRADASREHHEKDLENGNQMLDSTINKSKISKPTLVSSTCEFVLSDTFMANFEVTRTDTSNEVSYTRRTNPSPFVVDIANDRSDVEKEIVEPSAIPSSASGSVSHGLGKVTLASYTQLFLGTRRLTFLLQDTENLSSEEAIGSESTPGAQTDEGPANIKINCATTLQISTYDSTNETHTIGENDANLKPGEGVQTARKAIENIKNALGTDRPVGAQSNADFLLTSVEPGTPEIIEGDYAEIPAQAESRIDNNLETTNEQNVLEVSLVTQPPREPNGPEGVHSVFVLSNASAIFDAPKIVKGDDDQAAALTTKELNDLNSLQISYEGNAANHGIDSEMSYFSSDSSSSFSSEMDELSKSWDEVDQSLTSLENFVKSKTAYSMLGGLEEHNDGEEDRFDEPALSSSFATMDLCQLVTPDSSYEESVSFDSPTFPSCGVLVKRPGTPRTRYDAKTALLRSRLDLKINPTIETIVPEPIQRSASGGGASAPEDYEPERDPRTCGSIRKEIRQWALQFSATPYRPGLSSPLASATAISGPGCASSEGMRRLSQEILRLCDFSFGISDQHSSSELLVDVLKKQCSHHFRSGEDSFVNAGSLMEDCDPFSGSPWVDSIIPSTEPLFYCPDPSPGPPEEEDVSSMIDDTGSTTTLSGERKLLSKNATYATDLLAPLQVAETDSSSPLPSLSEVRRAPSPVPAKLAILSKPCNRMPTLREEDEQASTSHPSPPVRMIISSLQSQEAPPLPPRNPARRPLSPIRTGNNKTQNTDRVTCSGTGEPAYRKDAPTTKRNSSQAFPPSIDQNQRQQIRRGPSVVSRTSQDVSSTQPPSSKVNESLQQKNKLRPARFAHYLTPTQGSEAKRRNPSDNCVKTPKDMPRKILGIKLPDRSRKQISAPKTPRTTALSLR